MFNFKICHYGAIFSAYETDKTNGNDVIKVCLANRKKMGLRKKNKLGGSDRKDKRKNEIGGIQEEQKGRFNWMIYVLYLKSLRN